MSDHLGLKSGTVSLVPSHHAEWQEFYRTESATLEKRLSGLFLGIEHVGSTAIPGLWAKPIVDIMIGVRDLARLDEYIARLSAIGYTHKGEAGIPGRQFFTRGDPTVAHIHITVHGSEFWREHVIFRDHLAKYPKDREAYEALKKVLAAMYPNDRDAYTEGKSAFIADVMAQYRANI